MSGSQMKKYTAYLDLVIDSDNLELQFKLFKEHKIIIENNRVTVKAYSFNEARTYLDTIRAVINFIFFEDLKPKTKDGDLLNSLYMPPYKLVMNEVNKESEGTKYFHLYNQIILTKPLIERTKEIISIASKYDSVSVDTNYYYWMLKWFTFSLDEISINPCNMNIIAHPETLYLKFWTMLEIVTKKNIGNLNKKGKRNKYLMENDVKKLIEEIISKPHEPLNNLDKIRNEMIHEGKIFRNEYHLDQLINSCHHAINEVLKKRFRNIDELLQWRDKLMEIIREE